MYLAKMSFIAHLWQNLLGLPLWSCIIAAMLALLALIKRKAISAASSAAQESAKRKFFGWFRDNLPREKSGNERTYRGTFMGYHQYENPPHEWCFTLVENGVTHKVPTWQSNLLSGVHHGSVVEIDTDRLEDRATRYTILAVREMKKPV
jgi:hypothetical protein